MINRIQQDYLDPGNPIAFSAPGNVKRHYGNRYGTKPILETLQTIDGYTLHREFHKPRVTNPFYVYKKRQQLQLDLIDVSKLKDDNKGITFLMCAIDVFTKKVWVRALGSKSAADSLEGIKDIVEMFDPKPETIFIDRGTEFTNRQVQNYLANQGVKMMYPNSEKKAAVVERFNRTLQGLMYRYLTENRTNNYMDVMENLINSYNNRGHRSLNYMSPEEAELDENKSRVLSAHNERYAKLANKRKKPKYKVGDRVLVKNLPTNRFHRGYQRSFRHEQFEIIEVRTRMPIPMYIVKSLDKGDVIQGGFYAEELQPIRGDVYKMDVLKRRRYRGRDQVYVRWVGFGDQHNQWIDADTITNTYNPNPS